VVRAIRPSWREDSEGSPPPTSTTRRAVLPVITRVVKVCVGPNASSASTAVRILALDAGIWASAGVCDQITAPVAASVTIPARSSPSLADSDRVASRSATAWSVTESGTWAAAAPATGARAAATQATATAERPRATV
jgi:hypothetical protein